MSPSTTRSRNSNFQLPFAGQLDSGLAPRRILHFWTDEELNLLAYHRSYRKNFDWIRENHFPSLTKKSLIRAYGRLPAEERIHRTLAVAARITASSGAPQDEDTAQPNPTSGPSHPPHQPESSAEAPDPCALRPENDSVPTTSIDGIKHRYNLRPKRPTVFRKRNPRLLVDRLRFPRFFNSYRNHQKLRTSLDVDYIPPSHSPTPDPSDHSPSVISSDLSEASSLELFGLEARSPSP